GPRGVEERPAVRALADEGRPFGGALRELPRTSRRHGSRADERALPSRRLRLLGRGRGGVEDAVADDGAGVDASSPDATSTAAADRVDQPVAAVSGSRAIVGSKWYGLLFARSTRTSPATCSRTACRSTTGPAQGRSASSGTRCGSTSARAFRS